MSRWRITWACRPCGALWVVRRARTLDEGGTCPRCGGDGEMPWEARGLVPPGFTGKAVAMADRPFPPRDAAVAELNGALDHSAEAELRRVIPL